MTIPEIVRANAVPTDNVWFNLEVDDDADPMGAVTSTKYNVNNWTYAGPTLEGKTMRRVKLVQLGRCHNLAEAKKTADSMGYRLVEGQARDAFRTQFPKPCYGWPIIFGGSEWRQISPGGLGVASLCGFRAEDRAEFEWRSRFLPSEIDFWTEWRWLVEDKEPVH